jgi:DNA replication and repair protein RecF
VDDEKVSRLGDFLGQFPSVVFSSQDLQLLRGAPGGRRRWLDLTLSAMDRGYLTSLQTYHRGLAERNALLKAGGGISQLEAFELTMAPAAADLVARRRADLESLGAVLTQSYAQIADAAEPVSFLYAPDWEGGGMESFLAMMRESREKDLRWRGTSRGPQRDDYEFLLDGRPARDFASEGQQRLLVIALRLAQANWFEAKSGVKPIMLADDVVGELDSGRRSRFWKALAPLSQVMATGTQVPEDLGADWEIFHVSQGVFQGASGSGQNP